VKEKRETRKKRRKKKKKEEKRRERETERQRERRLASYRGLSTPSTTPSDSGFFPLRYFLCHQIEKKMRGHTNEYTLMYCIVQNQWASAYRNVRVMFSFSSSYIPFFLSFSFILRVDDASLSEKLGSEIIAVNHTDRV